MCFTQFGCMYVCCLFSLNTSGIFVVSNMIVSHRVNGHVEMCVNDLRLLPFNKILGGGRFRILWPMRFHMGTPALHFVEYPKWMKE